MEQFMLKLLNLSLTGGYVVLAVLLLRLALRRAPRWVVYALWAAPFARLALPFSFESAFSLVRVRPDAIPADIVYAQTPAIRSGIPALNRVVNAGLQATLPPADPAQSVNPIGLALAAAFVLWLLGLSMLTAVGLLQTLRLRRALRSAEHLRDNLYVWEGAETPFVFGLLRPRIYLPAGLDIDAQPYILAHEQHHIARFDHVLRPLAWCIAAVHWFNPLAWVACRCMSRDMERACDEAVLRRFGPGIRKAYSTALVELAAPPRALRLTPLGFAEGDIARRVRAILGWKRPALWLSMLTVCVALVAACGLMSSPPAEHAQSAPSNMPPDMSQEEIAAFEERARAPEHRHAQELLFAQEETLAQYFEIVHRGYGLTELYTLDDVADTPLTLYQLDLFYVPANAEQAREALAKTAYEAEFVQNGDQVEIRGITGLSRSYPVFDPAGELVLVLSDLDFRESSPMQNELTIRTYLEQMGAAAAPLYDSAHYIVTYQEYHPGVVKKLLLSQPVRQGAGGIWTVERELDADGRETLVYPEESGIYSLIFNDLDDFYTTQQNLADETGDFWMCDPLQVALQYAQKNYGAHAQIAPLERGTYDDFKALPVSTYEGWLQDMDDTHLSIKPAQRDENGTPTLWATGYPDYYDYLRLADDAVYTIGGSATTRARFLEHIRAHDPNAFVRCTYIGGAVTRVELL